MNRPMVQSDMIPAVMVEPVESVKEMHCLHPVTVVFRTVTCLDPAMRMPCS